MSKENWIKLKRIYTPIEKTLLTQFAEKVKEKFENAWVPHEGIDNLTLESIVDTTLLEFLNGEPK